MKYRKFAAIDIGSNAVRLLISNVLEEKKGQLQIRKNSLVRLPIRLGADVFSTGEIGVTKADNLVEAMQAFNLLMKIHKVNTYKAFATSAVRSASNQKELIKRILKKTGIKVEVINGKKEAEIIFLSRIRRYIEQDKSYLYIDVGGGSTEFTVFSKAKVIARQSFPVGTVRFIKGQINEQDFEAKVHRWITKNTRNLDRVIAIGSGGNINKLYKMAQVKEGTPLTDDYIESRYRLLKNMTYDERIEKLGLNPDRADVILPATRIYLKAMQWAGIKQIYVPKIGLVDGTIYYICKEKGMTDFSN